MNQLSLRVPLLVGAACLTLLAAACGSEGTDSSGSLPPISTTTTLFVPTSTTDPRIKLYELKPGENLAMVADAFDVPLESLINFNNEKFSDPNNVPVGVVLEIPPVVLIDELPSASTSSIAP